MKKSTRTIICVVLTCCMFLTILAPVSLAEQERKVYALHSLTVDSARETATVELLAREDCTLLVALYDRSGKLLDTESVSVAGKEMAQEQELRFADCGRYHSAKAFLTESGSPLCTALSVFSWEEELSDLPEIRQEELRYAAGKGLPVDKLQQQTVSGVEMTELLDAMVSLGEPEKLTRWQSMLPKFRSYEGALTRFDIMGSLMIAAETMGGRWAEPFVSLYPVWKELDFRFDDSFFTPEILDEVGGKFYLTPLRPDDTAYLDAACLCFNLGRPSPISGEFPIAYDEENKTIHEDVTPSYLDALLAVARMIAGTELNSGGETQEVLTLTEEKDAELQRELQEAIDEILTAETEIVHADTFIPGETYTGTAYYVSADGDDNNDGLTPETAWQTTDKVLEATSWGKILKTGDALFFRRGDTFRMPEHDIAIAVDGITLSAYGEGDKPIITASSESGVGAEKWELVYADDSGKKIWQFHTDLRDVASVVLNDAETATKRVYEFYGENGYESCTCETWLMQEGGGVTLLGELLPLQESLSEDLTFISRPDRGKMTDGHTTESGKGPLYLRCDAGNPGELYESVEFSEFAIRGLVWLEAGNTVIDNISFRCNGNSYIKANTISYDPAQKIFWTEYSGTVVQNCEFAYGGGSVTEYAYVEGRPIPVVQGDGIYTVVMNSIFRHNYFHDECSTSVTYEWALDDEQTGGGYYHVLDNVIVSSMAIRLDSTADSLKYLDSVIIRGNQIWSTGRWDNSGYYYSQGSVFLTDNYYGECVIENNVFYGTENGYEDNALLHIAIDLENYCLPTIRNNVYVQYAGRDFVYFENKDASWAIDDPDAIKAARRLLLDTSSVFYVKEN